MIGWRKLSSWALVFCLCAFSTWSQKDVPDGAREILVWVTGFFFGANAVKPLMRGVSVNLGTKKE